MTTADFIRCPDCTTPDACGTVSRCVRRTADELDALMAADADIIAAPDYGQAHAYSVLRAILDDAYAQAASGKGAERHANGQVWSRQPINTITEAVGPGFPAGQAIKKLIEALGMLRRGEADAARREILGAIVYAAALAHHIDGQRP